MLSWTAQNGHLGLPRLGFDIELLEGTLGKHIKSLPEFIDRTDRPSKSGKAVRRLRYVAQVAAPHP
jgi:hypothetical protein